MRRRTSWLLALLVGMVGVRVLLPPTPSVAISESVAHRGVDSRLVQDLHSEALSRTPVGSAEANPDPAAGQQSAQEQVVDIFASPAVAANIQNIAIPAAAPVSMPPLSVTTYSSVAPPAVANSPAPIQPPPLHVIGSWRDERGAKVFLASRRGVAWVQAGDVVDAEFVVTSVEPSIVSLRSNATGQTYSLPVPFAAASPLRTNTQ